MQERFQQHREVANNKRTMLGAVDEEEDEEEEVEEEATEEEDEEEEPMSPRLSIVWRKDLASGLGALEEE